MHRMEVYTLSESRRLYGAISRYSVSVPGSAHKGIDQEEAQQNTQAATLLRFFLAAEQL